MKRLILAILIVAACLSTVNAQTQKKAKRDTLYTITASKLKIVDGKPTDDFAIYNLKWADTLWNVSRDLDLEQPNLAIKNYRWYFYDKAHKKIRFERYVNERLDRRVRYIYDNSGLATLEHYQLNGADTVLVRKDILTRDSKGRVAKVKAVDGREKAIAACSYSYDEFGNEIKMKASMKFSLDADSVLNRQSSYVYDSLGRVVKKCVTTISQNKDKAYVCYVYTYTGNGKLESTTRYGKNGKMIGKEEIIYYSGRVSQRKFYDSDGMLTENLAFRYRKFGSSVDNNMY